MESVIFYLLIKRLFLLHCHWLLLVCHFLFDVFLIKLLLMPLETTVNFLLLESELIQRPFVCLLLCHGPVMGEFFPFSIVCLLQYHSSFLIFYFFIVNCLLPLAHFLKIIFSGSLHIVSIYPISLLHFLYFFVPLHFSALQPFQLCLNGSCSSFLSFLLQFLVSFDDFLGLRFCLSLTLRD